MLPSLSGAVVLMISATLADYGGIFSALLFPCMAKVILSQYHRLSSFQRLDSLERTYGDCIAYVTDEVILVLSAFIRPVGYQTPFTSER